VPKTLRKVIIIGLVLAACDLLLYKWYGNAVEQQFEGVNPAKADCAIVLFNDFTQSWTLNDETIRRCRHALDLFLKHRVSAIICSGGNRPQEDKSGAKLMFQWLSEHGASLDALQLEINSCDTPGNIGNSLRIAAAQNYSSALLVSSPLHLYRVKLLFLKKAEPNVVTVGFAPIHIKA
jgi:uncharacterized SAM-binding protein YcdF (DUF218 family)